MAVTVKSPIQTLPNRYKISLFKWVDYFYNSTPGYVIWCQVRTETDGLPMNMSILCHTRQWPTYINLGKDHVGFADLNTLTLTDYVSQKVVLLRHNVTALSWPIWIQTILLYLHGSQTGQRISKLKVHHIIENCQ